MYSLEKSMGIEIKRLENGVSEYNEIRDKNGALMFNIIKEKKVMDIHNVRMIKLESIFMIMELMKIKKEKKLDSISLSGGYNYYRDFNILKPVETECGKTYIVNEENVIRLYDLIETINNLQNVWCIRLNSGIGVKTKTYELSIVSRTLEEEYGLHIMSKKEMRFEIFDTFEKMEKYVLCYLKKLEVQEVFEDLYAKKSERLIQEMVGVLITPDTRNQLYGHKHVEALEKTLSFEKDVVNEITTFKTKGYYGSYVVAGDFVFAVAARKQGMCRNEVIIEKIKMDKATEKMRNDRYDKYEMALKIVFETIKNIEKKGVFQDV